jgi:arsenite methyltransferase
MRGQTTTHEGRSPVGVSRFLAGQLRSPSGFFGRVVLSRLLNRSNAAMNRLTMQSLALEPEDRVLEVGFGGGDLIARVAPVVSRGFVAGVDFSPDMVDVCARRLASLVASKRVEVRCATAEDLPYDADTFTKACTVNTIYFWPDPALCVGELRRVLREGGRLAVSFTPRSTMENLPATKHGFTLYEPDDVRRLLEDAGFAGIEMIPAPGPRASYVCAVGTRQPLPDERMGD